MTLYESLAPLYDGFFPLDPKTPAFLASLVGAEARGTGPRVLDAGCATGALAISLAARGWTSVGIDSEAAMIERARGRAFRDGLAGRASFFEANILEIGERFGGQSFDLVLCLGNTLPHLVGADGGAGSAGDSAAAAFLAQARELLAPGAAVVLQTLNFSLAGVGPGFVFPVLSVGDAVMKRSYRDPPSESPGTLRFVVEMLRGGEARSSETLLLPLSPRRVGSLLQEAGLPEQARFAGWDGRPFDEGRDLYCITVARPRARRSRSDRRASTAYS
jgi:SAM-dependent methyltransferase